MGKKAKICVSMNNSNYDASSEYSAGRFARYISQGEENRRKNSIRKGTPYVNQGMGSKTYERSPGGSNKFWERHEKRWKNSKESSGNKRKKTVKFGAVAGNAKTVYHRVMIPLLNGMEYWKVKVLERRIAKLFPKDCPVSIYMHHGKEYEGRDEDNDHLHMMCSDRHDYGIGRKVEKLFDSIFDERNPKGRPAVQDMIEDVLRQFYIDFGYEIDEPGTEESYMRQIERFEEKLKELENDSSRNKPFRKNYYKNKIEEYYEKIVEKKVEEFDREVEEFEKYKELEISGSVRSCREKYKYQVEDSIDKEEKINYVVDDKIKDKKDDKDKFEFKADVVLEAATNTGFEADVVFSAIDKSTYDKNEILYEESIKREEYEIERNAYIENERLASLGSDVLSQTARQGSGFKRPRIVSTLATQERVKGQYEARKKQKLQMWKENYEKQQVNKHPMSSRQVCLEQTSHSLDDQQTQQTAMSNIDEILNNAQSIRPGPKPKLKR